MSTRKTEEAAKPAKTGVRTKNSALGQKYKYKTKQYFIERGYDCEYIEKLQIIPVKPRPIFIKKDLWGADGVAMNSQEIIFWNSKYVGPTTSVVSVVNAGIAEFKQFKYPPFVKTILVVWVDKEKQPRFYDTEIA